MYFMNTGLLFHLIFSSFAVWCFFAHTKPDLDSAALCLCPSLNTSTESWWHSLLTYKHQRKSAKTGIEIQRSTATYTGTLAPGKHLVISLVIKSYGAQKTSQGRWLGGCCKIFMHLGNVIIYTNNLIFYLDWKMSFFTLILFFYVTYLLVYTDSCWRTNIPHAHTTLHIHMHLKQRRRLQIFFFRNNKSICNYSC